MLIQSQPVTPQQVTYLSGFAS
ncbi:hypothetical protein LCGC14_2853280, partial [marine sediment metagenome]